MLIYFAVAALSLSGGGAELPPTQVHEALSEVRDRLVAYAEAQQSELGLTGHDREYCIARSDVLTSVAITNGVPPFDDIFLASTDAQLSEWASLRLRFQQTEVRECLRSIARND